MPSPLIKTDQPKPTGEREIDVICELQRQLDAERETSQAHWQKWQDESKSHRNDIDYLNKEIQQLRDQLAAAQVAIQDARKRCDLVNRGELAPVTWDDTTALDAAIAEATKPLVDAMTKIRRRVVPDDVVAYMMELQDIAADALAKAQSYPLPDGRSK